MAEVDIVSTTKPCSMSLDRIQRSKNVGRRMGLPAKYVIGIAARHFVTQPDWESRLLPWAGGGRMPGKTRATEIWISEQEMQQIREKLAAQKVNVSTFLNVAYDELESYLTPEREEEMRKELPDGAIRITGSAGKTLVVLEPEQVQAFLEELRKTRTEGSLKISPRKVECLICGKSLKFDNSGVVERAFAEFAFSQLHRHPDADSKSRR